MDIEPETIERLREERARELLPQFVALLKDAVEGGASVGFTLPLADEVATRYWQDVFREVGLGSRVLLAMMRGDELIGGVQLALCNRPNGLHRAEVQKLLVLRKCRRQGIARALMNAIDQEARAANRSLLYLDTEPGKPAEAMYKKLGWIRCGEIPDFASTPDGHLHSTVLFFRRI